MSWPDSSRPFFGNATAFAAPPRIVFGESSFPSFAGWMIIYPLMMFLTAFSGKGLPWALDFILSGRFLAHPHPLHLWFLEYLIVLYPLAVAVIVGIRVLVPVNIQHLQMRSSGR